MLLVVDLIVFQKTNVIANQRARWCGDPLWFPEVSGGLPRQCAHWRAMTRKVYYLFSMATATSRATFIMVVKAV